MREWQGLFLSIELTDQKLCLKLLRLIPVSCVYLEDIDYLRASSFNEHLEYLNQGVKSQYWPTFFRGYKRRTTPVYMLKANGGKRRIFMRLQSGLHYRLRTALGKNNSRKNNQTPPPW